ncbi:MAG: 7TM diverse intracellular signaling domain-containing protein, partial [Sulfurimonas sp.]
DETNSLSKDEALKQDFLPNKEETLGFGFVPNKALWIRFRLKNNSQQQLHKILEYANATTEDVFFHEDNTVQLDGMWHITSTRHTLRPTFHIVLGPNEEKTFYIKSHSKISTLIAKLTLWEKDAFVAYENERKIYLFIFFAIICVLLLYNFMIYIFTRDKAYLYYILYLASVLFFQANYLGVAQLYLLSNAFAILITKASMIYISFLILTIVLFTREFLGTKRFKKLDFILKFYLFVTPFVAVLSYDNFLFDMNIIIFFIPLGVVVIFIALYTLYKGVKQARFYVLGWSFVVLSLIFINLRTIGLFDITHYFAYMNELVFILEALLFSIALAHRINILAQEKIEADDKLIAFQQEEQKRLETLVQQKTQALSSSLEEKELLYKELNHRVKNNLQMVLSLIKLQINKTELPQAKEELGITKNRINSIAKLYEILYLKKNLNHISTLDYFKTIVHPIEENFDKNVAIEYKIKQEIQQQDLIYCGLILNELVTNAFKYAFIKDGVIMITTDKKDEKFVMQVQDNGVGMGTNAVDSLGMSIVDTLTKKQLGGELVVENNGGTDITIKWTQR